MHSSPPSPWLILSSTTVFRTPWYEIVEDILVDTTGLSATYTYLQHPGSVLIVPFDENGQVILIHSYRPTVKDWCWEVPAGSLNLRCDDSPKETAVRELEEEVGGRCSEMISLGSRFLSNGTSNLKAEIFVARGVVISTNTRRDHEEKIREVRHFSRKETKRMVLDGTVNDGDSCLAILLALEFEQLNDAVNVET